MFKMGLHDPFGYLQHKLWPQKKGRESNYQFDSRPLKVKNRPYFLEFRWHATYCWKALDKGYNFVFYFTSIEGLHKKLRASKVAGIPIWGISKLPTWESQGACLVVRHREYYNGGRWWLSPSLGAMNLMNPCLPMACPCTKCAPTMH
jgi:hypothetical protein